MFEDEDFDDYFEEEQDRKAAVEKYETMLKANGSAYFDSEEFEYIIDHYTEQNELKKSRQAVEIAMAQHPESNLLKIKEARQYLLENDAQHAFELLQHIDRDEEEPDYFLTLGSCLALFRRGREIRPLQCHRIRIPAFAEIRPCLGFLFQGLAFCR